MAVLSQSTDELDLHNGFREFNFNLTLDELKDRVALKQIASSPNIGQSKFIVRNPGEYSVYDYPLQEIDLTFYKGQLWRIDLIIKGIEQIPDGAGISLVVFEDVKRSYGNPTSIDTSLATRIAKRRTYKYWTGRKVTLISAGLPSSVYTFINNDVYKKMYQEQNLGQGM